MNVFLTASAVGATMADVLEAIHTIIVHLVGGTAGTTTIEFRNSWVGTFLSTIVSDNGLFFIPFVLSLCLFGIHVLLSLMRK